MDDKQYNLLDVFFNGDVPQDKKEEILTGNPELQILINYIDKLHYLSQISIKGMTMDELLKFANTSERLNNLILKLKEQYKDV
jgi:hypothetical protein